MATYPTLEAKANFGEILRQVRAGQRVVIADHGKDVAEIRPLAERKPLAESLHDLGQQGIIGPLAVPMRNLSPVARREGALTRLLDFRD